MEDSSDKRKKPTAMDDDLSFDISTSTSHFSRDLLQRFTGTSRSGTQTAMREEDQDQDQDIELSLGLSLGGKFGVDKISSNLTRSSSLASCLPVAKDDNDGAAPTPQAEAAAAAGGSLIRTSSLPAETEEEWRKRKELQCLKRMEAKRRRSEKQRNMMRTESGFSRAKSLSLEEKRAIELNLRERLEREKAVLGIKRSTSLQFGSSSNHGSVSMEKGKESPSTDLEAKPPQGTCRSLSSASIESSREGTNQRQDAESSCKKMGSMGGDMPSVFTKGDGPHGKRVDGVLYKYGKGEQVKIMCICHGTFHSPPEFIRHAGGTDVDHPLKHIVLNPNSSAML